MEKTKEKILSVYNYEKSIKKIFEQYIFTAGWKFLFCKEDVDIDGIKIFFIFLLWDIEVDVLRVVGFKMKDDKFFTGETRFYEHTKHKISKNFNLKMNVIHRLNLYKYLNKPIKRYNGGKYAVGFLSCNSSVLKHIDKNIMDFRSRVLVSYDPTNLDVILSVENFGGMDSWEELIRYDNEMDLLRNQCFSHILPDYDKIIGIKT